MKRWEYVSETSNSMAFLDEWMNERGREGWQAMGPPIYGPQSVFGRVWMERELISVD